MSKRKSQPSSAFKAKVALAALKETRSVSQIAAQFQYARTRVAQKAG
jgi:hypothetical protein